MYNNTIIKEYLFRFVCEVKLLIYITGDTHIPIDIEKLGEKLFPEQFSMTRNDYVIVCGDFGGVWDNSPIHKYYLEKLSQAPYTLLFADGNHENFDMLESFPVSYWNGGKVHFVRDNIIHLMRGQVFIIDGKVFFVMGGGYSRDKFLRTESVSWWAREMPEKYEYAEGLKNLEEVGFDTDYIITHTAPTEIISKYYSCNEELPLNDYLSFIRDTAKYKKWFFGHIHRDEYIDGNFVSLYDRIYSIDEDRMLEDRCKNYDSQLLSLNREISNRYT